MKRANITSRERIVAALEGRPIDYVPFSPFLAYVWEHFPPEVRAGGQLEFHRRIGADPLWRGAPCPVALMGPPVESQVFTEDDRHVMVTETPVGTIRHAQARSDIGNTLFLVEHPVKTEEDCKTWLWIEEHTSFAPSLANVHEHFNGTGREGLSIGSLVPRGKTAFQWMVEHLIGTEGLIYALADYRDTVETLWRTMVAKNLEAARIAAEVDCYDYYLSWEDSSTQNYSPTLYKTFIAPEIAEWCRLLAANGKRYVQHACGHVRTLLPQMRESGVFAVESLSPPPTGNVALNEARDMLGPDVGIIGGIEPTRFLDLSNDELGPYVEQVLADGAGRFLLANSDSCPPGVTLEKFKIVADVTRSCRV